VGRGVLGFGGEGVGVGSETEMDGGDGGSSVTSIPLDPDPLELDPERLRTMSAERDTGEVGLRGTAEPKG
jgi:hypothetical protein